MKELSIYNFNLEHIKEKYIIFYLIYSLYLLYFMIHYHVVGIPDMSPIMRIYSLQNWNYALLKAYVFSLLNLVFIL